MEYAISAENISKSYRLYAGPRAMLKEMLLNIRGHELFTALHPLSFQIPPGESFGIIGNNGAGKSTLLKLLAGTSIPSTGEFKIDGKVGALLELGVGFHPDHTGRENIYFNGAIMGLKRQEVEDRIDEIIAFSELEQFIDEPVKTYSSGMYLRLGFSVATGFDFPILIIDEALAVGDQKFQMKCTKRIMEFKENGGTILFCSHNLHQVKVLCDRAVWLHEGRSMFLGSARETVEAYQDFLRINNEKSDREMITKAPSDDQLCWIEHLAITDREGNPIRTIQTQGSMLVSIEAYIGPDFSGEPNLGVIISRSDGLVIFSTTSRENGAILEKCDDNRYKGRLLIDNIPLMDGRYNVVAVVVDTYALHVFDISDTKLEFNVECPSPNPGIISLSHRWLH